MAYSLSNKCAKNLCKQTVLVQLIIKHVVTCYLEQCSMAHTVQTYHVALWPCPLTLEVIPLAADAGLCPPSTHQQVLRPYCSEDMTHFVCLR